MCLSFVKLYSLMYISKEKKLLMDCYVPATSTTFLAFFCFFLLRPLTVLMKQTRQVVRAVKQSILHRCLWLIHRRKQTGNGKSGWWKTGRLPGSAAGRRRSTSSVWRTGWPSWCQPHKTFFSPTSVSIRESKLERFCPLQFGKIS